MVQNMVRSPHHTLVSKKDPNHPVRVNVVFVSNGVPVMTAERFADTKLHTHRPVKGENDAYFPMWIQDPIGGPVCYPRYLVHADNLRKLPDGSWTLRVNIEPD